jgi:hypothetical protein
LFGKHVSMPLFGNVRAHVNARSSAYPIDLECAMPHRIPPVSDFAQKDWRNNGVARREAS